MSFSFMEHWPLKNIIYLLHTDEKYWVSKENNSIKLKSLLSFFLLLYSSLVIGSYVVHMTKQSTLSTDSLQCYISLILHKDTYIYQF